MFIVMFHGSSFALAAATHHTFCNTTEKQYHKIVGLLPKQRGNVDIENRDILEALIFRCKTGTPWRDMPQ